MNRSDADKLLALARESIAGRLDDRDIPPRPQGAGPDVDVVAGAFVTLHSGGRLRGCIGRIESSWPVWETVARMARAAAFEDPRFPPLERRDLGKVHLEISVLTPLALVEDVETIEVGRHGLVIEKGFDRGLLLPQVAVEQGWDRDTFLSQTCVKAMLPPDAWREQDTKIFAFAAEVFGE